MVDIGGFQLRARFAGDGAPAVVFESGLGEGIDAWDPVAPAVAKFARTVAYERAGLGRSDPAPGPRSFNELARQLRELLHRAEVTPPYVLVGHSLGGGIVRAYIGQYPGEVAGAVLIDPVTENAAETLTRAQLEQDLRDLDARSSEEIPPGPRAEWKYLFSQMLANNPDLRALPLLPAGPCALLLSGRNQRGAEAELQLFGSAIAHHPEARLTLTPFSGHVIQQDEPALVIEAIRGVVFPDLLRQLRPILRAQGAVAALRAYQESSQRYPRDRLEERTLNILGYDELAAGRPAAAIDFLRLNTDLYPESWNAWDSLAEACLASGQRERAKQNYLRSLQLNPRNLNAARMLRKLGGPALP